MPVQTGAAFGITPTSINSLAKTGFCEGVPLTLRTQIKVSNTRELENAQYVTTIRNSSNLMYFEEASRL